LELSEFSVPHQREKKQTVMELWGRRQLQGTPGTRLAGRDKGE